MPPHRRWKRPIPIAEPSVTIGDADRTNRVGVPATKRVAVSLCVVDALHFDDALGVPFRFPVAIGLASTSGTS